LSSRVRLAGFAPFTAGAFALVATRFAAGLMAGLGLGFGAMAAFDAFAAVAAFVTMGDDAGRGASEEEDLGNAALRRAGRADPEDVTLGSSQKLRSQSHIDVMPQPKRAPHRAGNRRPYERPCVKPATACRGVLRALTRSSRSLRLPPPFTR